MITLKYIYIFFSIIFILLLSCCNKSAYDIYSDIPIINVGKTNSIRSFSLDSIFVGKENFIDFNTSALKGDVVITFTKSDSAYVALENCNNGEIRVYNLENFVSPKKYYSPSSQKPCEEMFNLYISENIAYYLDEFGVLHRLKEGDSSEIVQNLNNNPKLLQAGLCVQNILGYYNSIFQNNDSLIFFPLANNFVKHTINAKKDFDYPITGVLNLKTADVAFAGINFPYILYKNDYGLLNKNFQYYFTDHLLYAFDALPEIWRFNLNNNSLERFSCKSSYQTDSILPINFKRSPETKDLLWQHFIHSARYERMIYDPFRNCYYRFFVPAMAQKNERGYFNTYNERRLVLMVLDEHFNIMGETILPPTCNFVFFAAASRNGLFMNYGPLKDTEKNGIRLLKITFTTQ